jgi:hypothetical protein
VEKIKIFSKKVIDIETKVCYYSIAAETKAGQTREKHQAQVFRLCSRLATCSPLTITPKTRTVYRQQKILKMGLSIGKRGRAVVSFAAKQKEDGRMKNAGCKPY